MKRLLRTAGWAAIGVLGYLLIPATLIVVVVLGSVVGLLLLPVVWWGLAYIIAQAIIRI